MMDTKQNRWHIGRQLTLKPSEYIGFSWKGQDLYLIFKHHKEGKKRNKVSWYMDCTVTEEHSRRSHDNTPCAVKKFMRNY